MTSHNKLEKLVERQIFSILEINWVSFSTNLYERFKSCDFHTYEFLARRVPKCLQPQNWSLLLVAFLPILKFFTVLKMYKTALKEFMLLRSIKKVVRIWFSQQKPLCMNRRKLCGGKAFPSDGRRDGHLQSHVVFRDVRSKQKHCVVTAKLI